MKLGISTATFFNKIVTEKCFDTLQSMGVPSTEIFFNSYCEYEEDFARKLAATKGNISVVSVHALGTQFEPELFNISPRVRDDADRIFTKVLVAAKIVGAEYFTFHGPLKLKRMQYNIDFDSFARKLNRLCDMAKEHGIKIAYENVHYSYFNEPSFFVNIKDKCKDIYATFDVKHAYQSGIPYKQYLEAMDGRLAVAHLCGVKLDNNTCMPLASEGIIDMDAVLIDIKKYNSDITCLLELYTSDYQSLNDVKTTFDVIRNKISDINNNKLVKFSG